jgi:Fic family protein
MKKPYMFTIRNGFRICQRCVAVVAKNAYDGLDHRPTFQYVVTSLGELAESLTRALGTLTARVEAVENRLALLESQADVTPVHTSKARLIQELLAANPALTVPDIQARTGVKADTIRRVIARQKISEREEG